MRFSITSVLAFAATAFAQAADFDPIYTPKSGETVPAGSTYTVTWDAPAKYAEGLIKIELIGGGSQGTQEKLADIASGIKNSAKSYQWTVDASYAGKAVYGLVFRLESSPDTIFQYSQPFHIKASDNQPSGSSSGSVTITTSHGIKTVSLSTTSTPVTSTAVTSTAAASTVVTTTSAPATTSTEAKTTIKYNTTLPANTSTTLVIKTSSIQSAPVLITSTAGIRPSTTAPSTIATPTAAANAVRVGSLTILGFVAAVLAM